jgi:hypothetical protein
MGRWSGAQASRPMSSPPCARSPRAGPCPEGANVLSCCALRQKCPGSR